MKKSIRKPRLGIVLAAIFAVAQLAILPSVLNWSERIDKEVEKDSVVEDGTEGQERSTDPSFGKTQLGDQAQGSIDY